MVAILGVRVHPGRELCTFKGVRRTVGWLLTLNPHFRSLRHTKIMLDLRATLRASSRRCAPYKYCTVPYKADWAQFGRCSNRNYDQLPSIAAPRLGKSQGVMLLALLQPLGVCKNTGQLGDPFAPGRPRRQQPPANQASSTRSYTPFHNQLIMRIVSRGIHSAAGPGQKHTFSIHPALCPGHTRALHTDSFGLVSLPLCFLVANRAIPL
jgi:hypothetical protein